MKATRYGCMAVLVVCLALGTSPGLADTVGNFDVVRLTDNLGEDSGPTLNNLGQIVWEWSYHLSGTSYQFYDGTNITSLGRSIKYPMLLNNQGQMASEGYNNEIYFSSDGSTFTQIATAHNYLNGLQLNDQGQMVWSDYDGTNWTICFFTNPAQNNFTATDPTIEVDSACLNNQGQVVWRQVDGNTLELWLYSGGQMSSFYEATGKGLYDLQINDQGQIIWNESTSSGYRVMLYDHGTVTPISDPVGLAYNLYAQINSQGQVMWLGNNSNSAHNCDIYLYSNGSITNVTKGQYNDEIDHWENNCVNEQTNFGPHLNNQGQIVWINWENDNVSEALYVYDHGAITELDSWNTAGSYATYCQINDAGQVTWNRPNVYDGEIYLATLVDNPTYPSYSRYDFTFSYNNGSGDSFTGSVYALTGYNGYQADYTQSVTDENGQTGSYKITAVTDLGSDSSKDGQVYVTSYSDHESGNAYTPVSNGTAAVGINYLGSEKDYIIESGVSEYLFGKSGGTFYEADLGAYSRYDFLYYYSSSANSDYYLGYVYAPTSFQTSGPSIHYASYIYYQPQELWGWDYSLSGGFYYISGITDGFASSYDKKSYITTYYKGIGYAPLHGYAWSILGVNSDGSTTAGTAYVADRTAAWEQGYAVSDPYTATFTPYLQATFPAAGGMAPGASLPAVWAAYWSQSSSLLEEERNNFYR